MAVPTARMPAAPGRGPFGRSSELGVRAARREARPSVSVIVPCFNYGRFLEGCVESVLSQAAVDVRVLIIDDRSQDDSGSVAAALAERDSRVEAIRHERNAGLIATANEGLARATGEYLALLSADDLLVPGSLARATAVMARHESVGMVYGRPAMARERKRSPRVRGHWLGTKVWPGPDWIRLRCRTATNCISSPEVLVRRSVQEQVGGYDARCFHCSDLNMWLRIAAVADVARVRGAPQAVYRVHGASMYRSQDGPLSDLRERRIAFESFFAAASERLPAAAEMAGSARRALARQALWEASRAVDRGLDDRLVDELSSFALDVYPETERLREWHGLRLRRRIGSGRSLLFFPFLITGAAHKLWVHAGKARWRVTGI